MKIECKNRDLLIDGIDFTELSNEERQNVWMRCIDYMRTHYNPVLAVHIARCVPCYLGKFRGEGEGFSIEI
jgi:hypothetical protein